MTVTIPKEGHPKYLFLIEAFAITSSPFKDLRFREKEVLAWLYFYNNENKNIPVEHRDKITFHRDTRQNIARNLGVSMDSLYNILMALKKYGLLEGNGDNMVFVSKYLKPFEGELQELTFKFK